MQGLAKAFPESDVDSVSVVSVIERTGTVLEKSGGIYAGLCPFHQDKDTPSLRVYPGTNSWCCFGSGCGNKSNGKLNGGGPVAWVKQKLGLSYPDAVSWITGEDLTPIELPKISTVKKKAKVVPDKLVTYWHNLLDRCHRRFYFHSRGFTDEFINREMWGWDGRCYTIPVWKGEPANSECLGVRRRVAPDLGETNGPKYKGLKEHNQPTVWGRWYCQNDNIVLGFAGEFDAARAVQDGLSAFSLVNGVNAFQRFPKDWANEWFPNSKFLLVVFDKKEESDAGKLAMAWSKTKGSRTARVLVWPPSVEAKDYCAFREGGGTVEGFKKLIVSQLERR